MSGIELADRMIGEKLRSALDTQARLRGTCVILDLDSARASVVDAALSRAGHRCQQFSSTGELFGYLRSASVNVIILGNHACDGPTITLVRLLRGFAESRGIPILMLGLASDEEVAELLVAGVDFFLQWPLHAGLVTAHVHALMRVTRSAHRRGTPRAYGCYTFDHARERVYINGEVIDLPRKEFEVAAFLFRNVDRIVTLSDLIESIWGTDAKDRSRTVVVHVSRIRKKLHLKGEFGYQLAAERAHGYRLVPVAREPQADADTDRPLALMVSDAGNIRGERVGPP